MEEEMNVVIQKYLGDTAEFSPDEEGYSEQYKLALAYCELVDKMQEREDKLNMEYDLAIKKLELEQERWKAEFEQRERFKEMDNQNLEKDRQLKQYNWEAERKTAGEWKDKEYEMWLKDHQQRATQSTLELQLKEQDISVKEKSNRAGVLSTVVGGIVGAASIVGGVYLGYKGLKTDVTSYNESPGTLKQSESIVSSSTKYLN